MVSNTRLSSTKPLGYLDKELFNSEEEALSTLFKEFKDNKRDLNTIIKNIIETPETKNAKKIVDNLVTIYRKAKFTYLPDDVVRNECDQLVALLDKWDFKTNNAKLGAIYTLWLHFLKTNSFDHSSRSLYAKELSRFKLPTDTYFAGQTELWKGVASYGECDIDDYNANIEALVNHTDHNSSCYYNIFKSINETRLFFSKEGGDLLNTERANYNRKIDLESLGRGLPREVRSQRCGLRDHFQREVSLWDIIGILVGLFQRRVRQAQDLPLWRIFRN